MFRLYSVWAAFHIPVIVAVIAALVDFAQFYAWPHTRLLAGAERLRLNAIVQLLAEKEFLGNEKNPVDEESAFPLVTLQDDERSNWLTSIRTGFSSAITDKMAAEFMAPMFRGALFPNSTRGDCLYEFWEHRFGWTDKFQNPGKVLTPSILNAASKPPAASKPSGDAGSAGTGTGKRNPASDVTRNPVPWRLLTTIRASISKPVNAQLVTRIRR